MPRRIGGVPRSLFTIAEITNPADWNACEGAFADLQYVQAKMTVQMLVNEKGWPKILEFLAALGGGVR